MKRLGILLFLVCLVMMASCGQKEEILHMGLNAEIVDIDADNAILYIRDMDGESAVFGEKCTLDCQEAIDEAKILYVNYESGNVRSIAFAEFVIGDTVIVNLYDSEKANAKNDAAVAEQVQLATQRIN